MTDEEYEHTRTRLERLFAAWQPLIVPPDWQVSYDYERDPAPLDGPDWVDCMSTHARWAYLKAQVTVNVPAMADVEAAACPGGLEAEIIHELLHIPLAEVRHFLADEHLEHEERVVSTLTRVIQRVAERFFYLGHQAGQAETLEDARCGVCDCRRCTEQSDAASAAALEALNGAVESPHAE